MPCRTNSIPKPLLESLGRLHSSFKEQAQKNALLASVANQASREQLWKCGWKFSKDTFTRVRKGAHLQPRAPPKHALSPNLKEMVKKFFQDNCLPSGGKTFKKKGEEIQALFYDETLVSLWKKFCLENPTLKISYSSFCKLRPAHCIKAQLRTDVCPKCKFLKALLKKNSPSQEDKNLIKTLMKHRESAHVQRDKFKEELESLKQNPQKGIIIIDFKENYRFWHSREQDANAYRNNLISTIFNVSVFISRNQIIQVHNWTFCSNNLSHDSFFVKEALRQVFQTREFQDLEIESVSFWMDGGPHFRSHELNALFVEIFRSKQFKEVKWNHYLEYHGKNYCDVHFSVINHIFKVKI